MSGRGLEPGLFPDEEPDVAQTSNDNTTIVEIIRFGQGWLDVMTPAGPFRREGGSLSWRYHNPGNLKYGPFAQGQGAIGPGWGNHSVFANPNDGMRAKGNLLFLPSSPYYNLTILQAMNRYAPRSDKGKGVPQGGNDPDGYARYLGQKVGVSISTRLSSLTPDQRYEMVKWMNVYEGFKVGTIRPI